MEQLVADWIKLGAVFIGGCCRVSANDIARIKDVVDAVMHSEKAMKGQWIVFDSLLNDLTIWNRIYLSVFKQDSWLSLRHWCLLIAWIDSVWK